MRKYFLYICRMKISKNQILEKSGIYIITNLLNKKVYIGQSKNIYRRGILHRFQLNNNNHCNSHLQHSFNKYGKDNFSFEVIEYCENNILTEREKYHISIQQVEIYNVRDAEDSFLRQKRVMSDEQKLKISQSMKGKTPSNIKEFVDSVKRRKVAYYENNILIKIFDSCVEGAKYFKMCPKIFWYHIGKQRKQKSKYFTKNTKLEYYD